MRDSLFDFVSPEIRFGGPPESARAWVTAMESFAFLQKSTRGQQDDTSDRTASTGPRSEAPEYRR